MHDPAPYRELFPITNQYVFMNHAGVSALNTRAVQAMAAFNEQMSHQPVQQCFPMLMALMKEFKQRLVKLINARSVDEIVPMPNTAAGINTAALSLPLQPGDNVLLIEGDYPANVYPWMNLARRGVLTKMVPTRHGGVDIDLLKTRIDRRTRVVAMSTVQFATGFRNDVVAVGQLCRERGIYFAVDGIQSLGALPLDVQAANIDFLSCGSQKWMLGPIGAGFLYVRRELLDELVPGPYVGAASTVDWQNFLDYNFTLLPSADRFALGSPNFAGYTGMCASLGLIQEVGIEHVAQHIGGLIDLAINELGERGFTFCASTEMAHRSGILIVEIDQPERMSEQLLQVGIVTVPRGRGVRLAPHFYNTFDEIRQVAATLERLGQA